MLLGDLFLFFLFLVLVFLFGIKEELLIIKRVLMLAFVVFS